MAHDWQYVWSRSYGNEHVGIFEIGWQCNICNREIVTATQHVANRLPPDPHLVVSEHGEAGLTCEQIQINDVMES